MFMTKEKGLAPNNSRSSQALLHLVPFHAKVKRNGQIDSTLVFWNPTATAVWRLISGETPPLEPADGEPVNLTACQPEYPRTVSITSIEAQPSESIAGITSIPNCPAEAPSGIFQIRFFEDDWRIRHPQRPNHFLWNSRLRHVVPPANIWW